MRPGAAISWPRSCSNPGVNLCENEFRIDIRDATAELQRVPAAAGKGEGAAGGARDRDRSGASGTSRRTVVPPPDRDELVLDGFTAVHAGAVIWLNGSKRPIPGSRDRKLTLHVGGNNCPMDADLKARRSRSSTSIRSGTRSRRAARSRSPPTWR